MNGIKAPIGTGPWILQESKLNQYDVFVRNENYWGEKPAIKKITFNVIPDPTALARIRLTTPNCHSRSKQ